jgi:hypothetical protein
VNINQLHKLTGKLIKQGAGRRSVCIDKTTFTHPLENDGVAILPVEVGELKVYGMRDDDGFSATDKRGREITRASLVLFGEYPAPKI